MSLVLNESVVLAKTRSQDLKSVLKLNCWGSGIKEVSLVRQLVNVEIICLSCNEITTLEDFAYCKRLKELILRKNKIKNIAEIAHLQKLPNLNSLWLQENPCVETTYNYRKVVLKALPQLKVLDNQPVTREELQEIEELGNEIYEEIPYESSSSHSSGPSSHNVGVAAAATATTASNNVMQNKPQSVLSPAVNQQIVARQAGQTSVESQPDVSFQQQHNHQQQQQHSEHNNQSSVVAHQTDPSFNEMNLYPASNIVGGEPLNETISSSFNYQMNDSSTVLTNANRNSRLQQTQSQGSMNGLNSSNQFSNWSCSNNNNNNNNNSGTIGMLPKGGKSRNANIISAILCLVKELDYVGCEVVQTALHCRMEETSQ